MSSDTTRTEGGYEWLRRQEFLKAQQNLLDTQTRILEACKFAHDAAQYDDPWVDELVQQKRRLSYQIMLTIQELLKVARIPEPPRGRRLSVSYPSSEESTEDRVQRELEEAVRRREIAQFRRLVDSQLIMLYRAKFEELRWRKVYVGEAILTTPQIQQVCREIERIAFQLQTVADELARRHVYVNLDTDKASHIDDRRPRQETLPW